jgi:hypothetical protein
MTLQFDLEQNIMNCWNICEDLDVLTEGVLERDLTADQIANVLMGLKQLYQLKFERTFENYELLLKQNAQKRNEGLMVWEDSEDEDE